MSGDIGTAGDTSDNCYHVFYHPMANALTPTAVLDGFTITSGHADGATHRGYGGGMLNYGARPVIRNCTFSENRASEGGGMYNASSYSPTVMNCAFIDNGATDYGGGILNTSGATTIISNCSFSAEFMDYNDAFSHVSGAGICNISSASTITDSDIKGSGDNRGDADGNALPDDQELGAGETADITPETETGWRDYLYYLAFEARDGTSIQAGLRLSDDGSCLSFFKQAPDIAEGCPARLDMGIFSIRLQVPAAGAATLIRLYFSPSLLEEDFIKSNSAKLASLSWIT